MTHKERVLRSIRKEGLDRFPTQITFTPDMARILSRHLGVSEEELPSKLDNHIVMASLNDTVRVDPKEGIRYDNWGIGWDMTLAEGYWIRSRPLENLTDLDRYDLPDPHEGRLYSSAKETVKRYGDEYFILADQGFCLFERAHCLRGFENTLMDLLRNRGFIEELLDRITEYQVAVARRFVDLGVDGGYTGDDFGHQRGLIFSPELWRKFFKPRYERIWKVYKSAGLPVFHHSCGDIREILPDMIELGLDVLNPVQPQAMPIEELAARYGETLTFWGGISTQVTLPFGTPEEVQEEVLRCMRTLGRNNGYIIGPSHDLTTDVPLANFDALLLAIRRYNTSRRKGRDQEGKARVDSDMRHKKHKRLTKRKGIKRDGRFIYYYHPKTGRKA